MADPIEDIIGDYRAFAAQQRDRLATRGIDVTSYGLSHLAYRVRERAAASHQPVPDDPVLHPHTTSADRQFYASTYVAVSLTSTCTHATGAAPPLRSRRSGNRRSRPTSTCRRAHR